MFCLGDHKHRPVDTTDLIATGEEDSQISVNWYDYCFKCYITYHVYGRFRRCLDLAETLLDIASIEGLLGRVIDIFNQAVDVCPEILFLSLSQVQVCLNAFVLM